MADDFVQVGSPTKKIDNTSLTVAGNVVDRQRVIVSDTTDTAGFQAVVKSVPPSGTYGAVVWISADQLPLPVTLAGPMSIASDPTNPISITGQTVDDIAFVGGVPVSLGAKPSALSIPVVLPTDQAGIVVTGSVGITGGTVTANQGGSPWTSNITQVGGASLAFGSALSASSLPVVIASDQAAVPVSFAAGSLVNAILVSPLTISNDPTTPIYVVGQTVDDIAFVGGVPLSLGQKLAATSVPVVLATDQPSIPVTATVTNPSFPVTLADGASAVDGTTLDAALLDDFPGTNAAKLRGINAQLATSNRTQREIRLLLLAILAQLNVMGQQQGVSPAVAVNEVPILN